MTSKYTTKASPSETGNGYEGIVLEDGRPIYASGHKHAEHGVFGDMSDALTHARAWAAAMEAKADTVATLREERRAKLGGEILVLKTGASDDLNEAKSHSAAASTCKVNAAGREKRIGELAEHAENPLVRIIWDRDDPAAVSVVPEECAWSVPLEVRPVENQLSIPGVVWHATRKDGQLTRLIGHGRVEIDIDGDHLFIRLGADEHTIEASISGFVHNELGYRDPGEAAATASPPGATLPKAPKKREAIKAGSLKASELCKRIEISGYRPATLLGIYDLELKGAARSTVLKALSAAGANSDDQNLLLDMGSIEDGRPSTGLTPDHAAAALVTVSGLPATKLLERMVPACLDPVVLGDILDDELELGEEARDEVVTVVRQRLAELRDATVTA